MNETAQAAPKTFGPFEVIAKIGEGANATVYKVRHQPTGKIAALKVGASFIKLEADVAQRFQQEFTMIRPLRHPNIVRALALGEQDDVPYIVLEFVPGQNLEQRLKENGPLSAEETVAIFLQIVDGLAYLHSNQILHRDIKPSNVFLTPDNRAKLGDFGLIKKLTHDSHLTHSRQALGTIEYGAPEQFEDAKHVDPSCDLYSLGATFYTALTGKFPFGNGGQMKILQRKLLNQFVPLRLLVPALDPVLDDLVSRCLNPDPSMRPDKCEEFYDALRNYRAAPASGDAAEAELGTTSALRRIGRDRRMGIDRRASIRFAVDLTTTFVPFHQNMRGRWEGTVLDVSPMGMRLQTPRPVAINSVLQVSLGKGTRTELALVRWVKPGEGDTQIVGCSFVHPLSAQDFDALNLPADCKPVER